MRMSDEQDNKMEVDGEMVRPAAGEPSSEPFKDKYRDLKSKLKFLVYVSACFSCTQCGWLASVRVLQIL